LEWDSQKNGNNSFYFGETKTTEGSQEIDDNNEWERKRVDTTEIENENRRMEDCGEPEMTNEA
jgi:hypothetical protein